MSNFPITTADSTTFGNATTWANATSIASSLNGTDSDSSSSTLDSVDWPTAFAAHVNAKRLASESVLVQFLAFRGIFLLQFRSSRISNLGRIRHRLVWPLPSLSTDFQLDVFLLMLPGSSTCSHHHRRQRQSCVHLSEYHARILSR